MGADEAGAAGDERSHDRDGILVCPHGASRRCDLLAQRGLGVSAGGSWEAFAAGARDLWARRTDRDSYGPALRQYVTDVHGRRVADSWAALLLS